MAMIGGVALFPGRGDSADYTFTTVAGSAMQAGSKDGAGGGAGLPMFNKPIGVAVNSAGGIYVSDTGNQLIRLVAADGTVTTFAGTAGLAGGKDGAKTDAGVSFNTPQGAAVDSAGNVYIADYAGGTIRKITSAGVVSTLAGTAGATGSTDGTGAAARFFNPSAVAVDSAGNVYVADSGNNTIRKITSAGVVTTLAGKAGVAGAIDATGDAARFNYPRGVAVDSSGNVYVADGSNNLIRKITSAGVVTTVAGTAGTFGSTDGPSTTARFQFPNSLAIDAGGNLYVADENNHTIRKITSGGTVSTLAGLAGTAGREDGNGTSARFDRPAGVAVDSAGNVIVADYGNQLIRKVTPAGVVTTVAGSGGITGLVDGQGYSLNPSLLRNPSSLTVAPNGMIYIADTGNNTIRQMASSGAVTNLAGNSAGAGFANGNGTSAFFFSPGGITTDGSGNVYVADTGNQLIRKISPTGDVTTVAGTTLTIGNTDGAAASAKFNYPSGVAVDGAGNVFVADYGNHTIRRIGTDGNVTTFAGAAGASGSADGAGGSARFEFPRSLAIDAGGNLYVTDSGNHTIRKVSAGGFVTTLAGSAGSAGSTDGAAGTARFNAPGGIAVDAAGNLYVSDSNNSTLRMVTPAGVVTTIGGSAGNAGTVDGTGSAARFNHPNGVAVRAGGMLYVADTQNHTIREGLLPGMTGGVGTGASGSGGGSGGGSGSGNNGGSSGGSTTIPGEGLLLRPTGMTADSAGNYYIADTANNVIRKVTADGTTSVLAGKEGTSGSADGTGTAASFNNPAGITTDLAGNLYVCDSGNSTIRKITAADGVVTTLTGKAGTQGTTDGDATTALFNTPSGIVYNALNQSLYVTDSVNNTIRRVTTAGVVTTLAGTARVVGDVDGVGKNALFNNPTGIAIDPSYILYVTDTFNHTVRQVTTLRRITATAAGQITTPGSIRVVLTDAGLTGSPITLNVDAIQDEIPSSWAQKVATALAANTAIAARFSVISSGATIVLTYLSDDTGEIANLSLANGTSAGVVAAPTSTATAVSGTVTTLAGSAGISGSFDGTGINALFNLPRGITVDGSYNLYIADTGNSSIRRITTRGVVTTLAGIPGVSGFRDGAGNSALFNQPQGILNFNYLWVVDTGNSVIRAMNFNGATVTSLGLKKSTTTTGGGSSGGGSSSGGGGGGAPSLWFLAALGLLAGSRRWRRNR